MTNWTWVVNLVCMLVSWALAQSYRTYSWAWWANMAASAFNAAIVVWLLAR